MYDWTYRILYAIRRNRFAIAIYSLVCTLFLVVGVAVGVSVADKSAFAAKNGASVFLYLRGERGGVAFFFVGTLVSCAYILFSASVFLFRALSFLSIAPCIYGAYSLGMNVSVIISVYSVSALPMLLVAFVPAGVAECCVLCAVSVGCIRFAAQNGGCSPTRAELIEYYRGLVKYFFAAAVCSLASALSVALFGSALVGMVP